MQGRDGRILPATHWASFVVFVILVPALLILWGLPGRTADAWAWTIKPDLTPIFLGAGYGAGAYFFLRTFLAKQFHPSSAGIFGAAFFATLMLIATLIHWDRFNHGDAPPSARSSSTAGSPLHRLAAVVFALWWFNRRTDSGEPAPGEAMCRSAPARRPGVRGRRVRRRGRLLPLPGSGDRHLALDTDAADLARARLVHRAGRRRRADDLPATAAGAPGS